MSELCRFYGIVIRMYFDDHLPAHFHAVYGGDEAVIGIETLAVLNDASLHGREASFSNGRRCVRWNCGKHGNVRNDWNLLNQLLRWNRCAC